MATSNATLPGVPFESIQPQIKVTYPSVANVPAEESVIPITEQPVVATLYFSKLKTNLFSEDLSLRDQAIDQLDKYFKEDSSNENVHNINETIDLLIYILEQLTLESKDGTLSGIIVVLSENIGNLNLKNLKDEELMKRLKKALAEFKASIGAENSYINRFIIDLQNKFPIKSNLYEIIDSKVLVEVTQRRVKIEKLMQILFAESTNEETKLVSTIDLYKFLASELKTNPNNIELIKRILDCFVSLSLKLDFSEDSVYQKGTFQNTIFTILFGIKKYFSNIDIAKRFQLTNNYWLEIEEKLINYISPISGISSEVNSSKLMQAISKNPADYLLIWSENFKKLFIEELFTYLDTPERFQIFESILKFAHNNINPALLDFILNWLKARSTPELLNIVLNIQNIADKRVKSENLDLDNLTAMILHFDPLVEVEVNNRLFKVEVDKSRAVEEDLKTIFEGFQRFNNKDQLIEQEVQEKADESRLMNVNRRIPISRLRNHFQDKWREHQTELAKVSLEAQINLGVDKSINILNAYFFKSEKSLSDFLKFAIIPSNIDLVRRIFVTLVNIYRANSPEGFRARIFEILNKALINPQLVEMLPEQVKALPIIIWNLNLGDTANAYQNEYLTKRDEVVKLKSGQSLFNTARRFLGEKDRKQNELSQISDRISSDRYQTVFALKKIITSPVLFKAYSDTAGFADVLKMLYSTTLEREPLNEQDKDILRQLYLTDVWKLLPENIRAQVLEKVLQEFISGSEEDIALINKIQAREDQTSQYVASVYFNMLKNNQEFRTKVDELEQREQFSEFEYRIVAVLDYFHLQIRIDGYNPYSPETQIPENNEIEAELLEFLDLINSELNPRELIKILRDFYLYILDPKNNTNSLKDFFGLIYQKDQRIISEVLNKLLLTIHMNKRNLVLSSLCQEVFKRIVELAPTPALPRNEQSTPFDNISKIKNNFPKVKMNIGSLLQAKVDDMQQSYENKFSQAA